MPKELSTESLMLSPVTGKIKFVPSYQHLSSVCSAEDKRRPDELAKLIIPAQHTQSDTTEGPQVQPT